MERFRILPLALAAASLATVCASLSAQTAGDTYGTPPKAEPAGEAVLPTAQFSSAGETVQTSDAIEFRSLGQITQKDSDLAEGARTLIARRAELFGMELNRGHWSYDQLVCSAMPNHLFLRFTENGGAGDVSEFSVSIPRGEGQLRVIPILRRGYSLFTPAPSNVQTIEAFNRILTEEHPVKAPGWLESGLCYAALAGAQPEIAFQASPSARDSVNRQPLAAMPAVMKKQSDGGAIIRFADKSSPPRPIEWTMIFDGKGRLIKATRSPAPLIREKTLQSATAGAPASPKLEPPQETPKETSTETPRETSTKTLQETPKDASPKNPGVAAQEAPKAAAQEAQKGPAQETPHEISTVAPQESPKEASREVPHENPQQTPGVPSGKPISPTYPQGKTIHPAPPADQ